MWEMEEMEFYKSDRLDVLGGRWSKVHTLPVCKGKKGDDRNILRTWVTDSILFRNTHIILVSN